jgi:arylsulfatase A-like enzyme
LEGKQYMKNKLSRRKFLASLSAGSAYLSLMGGCAQGVSTKLPNVLVIQPDQHRGTIMGCAGDKQAITPNLDRLAAEGIRFTNCITSSPVCSPFRATMQTGLYPHTHGIDKNNILLNPQYKTIANVFADKGYATGYIGKWHLDGGIPDPQPGGYIGPGPRRQGYQEWYGYEKSHEYFKVWKYNENRQQERVEGYDWEPTWHTDMFLDFAKRNRDKSRPWMYYLAYGPPHVPEQCPQKYLDMFDPESFELPPDVADRFSPEVEKKLRLHYQMYYAQVKAVDDEIGRIMAGLKELGQDKNTIIFYTSDHGDFLGSHARPNKLRGKSVPYQTAFRIPLLIRWPQKIKPNQINDELINSVDLAPTLLELAGRTIPDGVQGDSMASWCTKQDGTSNEALYIGLGGADGKNGWRALFDGRYIYAPIRFNVLYDIKDDPFEENNLFNKPESLQLKKQLGQKLVELARRTEDPMLPVVEEVCKV